jgi:hypothetical protein
MGQNGQLLGLSTPNTIKLSHTYSNFFFSPLINSFLPLPFPFPTYSSHLSAIPFLPSLSLSLSIPEPPIPLIALISLALDDFVLCVSLSLSDVGYAPRTSLVDKRDASYPYKARLSAPLFLSCELGLLMC